VRRSRALLGALAVLVGAYVYLATFHRPQRAPDRPYFDAPRPWVVAHRGGTALAPENTMEAFRRAEALGVDVLEMDLRVTADGAIVVIHDSTVDRTTNGHGLVAELTLAQLQTLDAGYRFLDDSGGHPFRGTGLTVPSFESVLRQFPHIRLNAEMKDFTLDQAPGLCGVLRQFHAVDGVLVSAFDQAAMTAFREACPEVATGATRREAIVFYCLNRVRLGRMFRSPAAAMQLPPTFHGRAVITPRLLESARESNRPVQVWTVNDEEDMRRFLSLDVQAILTDRPSRLLALMGRSRRPTSGPEGPVDGRTVVRRPCAEGLDQPLYRAAATYSGLDRMDDASATTTGWVRRLREPALVFAAFLAAAWLAPLVSGWRLLLQSVLGIGAALAIVRSAMRDGVAPSELGLRVDNLFASSFLLLLLTVLPLAPVHMLAGGPSFRPSEVLIYLGWAFFQQFVVVAGVWRHFCRRTGAMTTWRSGLGAAALAAFLFALAHAPNLLLMGLVFGAEVVWLVCFTRFRNLFALALAHSLAAIVVKHDLVPRWLPSMKVGLGYWQP